ncbi:MAG: TIGR02646 family protein [Thiomargarita sp.]|nr:TIGR02646 family protein [Thiomargarita sp.]
MFKIIKNPPDYFAKSKRKVEGALQSDAWKNKHISEIRTKLREHILSKEQFVLCAYCEKKIDETADRSNIDHFKTRNLFPNLTLDYNNLLVSCNIHGRCSNYKDKNIKLDDYNKILHPVLDNPHNFFNYLLTGEIYSKNNLSLSDKERAELTIDLFQLNHRGLIEERKKISKQLIAYKECKQEEVVTYLLSYKSFITCFYEKF